MKTAGIVSIGWVAVDYAVEHNDYWHRGYPELDSGFGLALAFWY